MQPECKKPGDRAISESNSQDKPPAPPPTDEEAKESHCNESNSEGLQRPKEDAFAWLQVLGAFCLNLNTWSAPFRPPRCRRVSVC
jgi:hypothetical protein